MIDPKPKLIAVLGNAQEYLDLAVSAKDRGEREFYERIAELYRSGALAMIAVRAHGPPASGAVFERFNLRRAVAVLGP